MFRASSDSEDMNGLREAETIQTQFKRFEWFLHSVQHSPQGPVIFFPLFITHQVILMQDLYINYKVLGH